MAFRESDCRRCGAKMIWVRTARGKRMPMDAAPTRDGQFVIEGDEKDPITHKLANWAASTHEGDKYTSHFATCPNADEFRNKTGSEADA